MIYAYIRVSTEMQTFESQRYEIDRYCTDRGLTVDRWVTEAVSGMADIGKRTLGKTIRRMRRGDMLLCTEISRLGRNMLMVMAILDQCSSRGIVLHTIKDRFDLNDSINSKIIAFAFALAAEIERNLISQRTREALAAKRQVGVRLGRPKGRSAERALILSEREAIDRLRAEGLPLKEIARRYHINRNTLARHLKE